MTNEPDQPTEPEGPPCRCRARFGAPNLVVGQATIYARSGCPLHDPEAQS